MLSDALFPEPDAPPHEQTIDNTEKLYMRKLLVFSFYCYLLAKVNETKENHK